MILAHKKDSVHLHLHSNTRIERKIRGSSHWSTTTTLFHSRPSLTSVTRILPPHRCVAGKSPQDAKESFYQEWNRSRTQKPGEGKWAFHSGDNAGFGTGNSGTRSVWPSTLSAAACNDYWHGQYSFCHRDPLCAASSKLLAISSQSEKAPAAD